MVKVEGDWVCKSCDPDKVPSSQSSSSNPREPRSAELSSLPTTDSGSVKKEDAMQWLQSLDQPSPEELNSAFIAKPSDFKGSTYPTSISNIRITGDPEFVETVAGLFNQMTELEGARTRVEINLQKTEDRDSGELTGNYALYLSVAERG